MFLLPFLPPRKMFHIRETEQKRIEELSFIIIHNLVISARLVLTHHAINPINFFRQLQTLLRHIRKKLQFLKGYYFLKILILCLFKPTSPQATLSGVIMGNTFKILLWELIKDALLLLEEDKKALMPDGFELRTARSRDHRSNHFTTTTALKGNYLSFNLLVFKK